MKYSVILPLLAVVMISCKDTTPPVVVPRVKLSLTDSSMALAEQAWNILDSVERMQLPKAEAKRGDYMMRQIDTIRKSLNAREIARLDGYLQQRAIQAVDYRVWAKEHNVKLPK